MPNIRALGVIGDAPFGNAAVANTWYGAVGANMEIPVFNGFLYTAREREARLRAEASGERLRDMRNQISRDVRTSWLNANAAYQKLDVTQQLLQQANPGLKPGSDAVSNGLSSIVELSQAQLQQTQAEISYVQAGYDYQLSLATLTYETKGLSFRTSQKSNSATTRLKRNGESSHLLALIAPTIHEQRSV